jgi:2-polyprenyl-3-methyl-5-hydroxy-6-metoxy-1,4-benzoquinol methylase
MTLDKDLEKIKERESRFWDSQISAQIKEEKDLLVDEYNLNVLESFVFQRLGDLKEKKVLDCGCGSGFLSSILAKRGAIVYAFDISQESVKLTKKRAEVNGVSERVFPEVMAFEELSYEDEFFDLAVGFFILHHINIEKGGRQLKRVLKRGGRAVFIENSSRNPLLMLARKLLTGRFGIPKHGSADEFPLSMKKIERLGEIFEGNKVVYYKNFFFFRLLDEFIFRGRSRMAKNILKFLDDFFYNYLPFFRRYSYLQIVEFNKL